jgi:excisionase family DNA binding protein
VSPLLDLPAAAAILGVSACTLRRAVSAGKVPHRRIGGVIRFTEEDIRQYVESCAVGVRGVPEPAKVISGGVKPLAHYLSLARQRL